MKGKGNGIRLEETGGRLTALIRSCLWTHQKLSVCEDAYVEMNKQALVALPAQIMPLLEMSDELRNKWKIDIYQQIVYNVKCRNVQKTLPLSVPYVILKGTTAAQYYPQPLFRSLGDIDIMTKREDFNLACEQLLADGYKPINDLYREYGFIKDGIKIELHRSFALLNDADQARFLDDLILDNINPTHELPDLINGLVLLEHISQHLESGLGLRQIIDWMMFVDKNLSDDVWPQFRTMAKSVGLEKLAVVTTRMCSLFLGLPSRGWSKEADFDLCTSFMDYVLSCGNFGNKMIDNENNNVSIMTYGSTPRAMLVLLQQRGVIHWKAAQKHWFLRPFAWLFQIGRYIGKIVMGRFTPVMLINEFMESRRRSHLFNALEIRRFAKGRVSYRNGEYIKD